MKKALKFLVLFVIFAQGTTAFANIVFITTSPNRYNISSTTPCTKPSILQSNHSVRCEYRRGGAIVVSLGSSICIFSMQNAVQLSRTMPFCRVLNPTIQKTGNDYTVTIK
jgi:hypothetical protein